MKKNFLFSTGLIIALFTIFSCGGSDKQKNDSGQTQLQKGATGMYEQAERYANEMESNAYKNAAKMVNAAEEYAEDMYNDAERIAEDMYKDALDGFDW